MRRQYNRYDRQFQNPPVGAEEEVDPLDAFMDNLYNENKEVIESNDLHLVKSQVDYREELKEQYLTQHEAIEKTRKELTLPESQGPAKNTVVKKLQGTTFIKGEKLFGANEGAATGEYVLGSDARDLDNVQGVSKASKNRWEINKMFREYFSRRSKAIKR